jgi:flagellar basal body-associated protein FliL
MEEKNYKQKYEKEKKASIYLIIALVILVFGLFIMTLRLERVTEEKENLCYLNHKLTDVTNDLKELLDINFKDIIKIDCYSGDAERRLSYGE